MRPLVGRRGTATAATTTGCSSRASTRSRSNADARHISIFGGKLTDCLNVGEEVTEHVRALGVELPYPGARWYGEPPDEVRDEFFHQARLMRPGRHDLAASRRSRSRTRLWRRYGGERALGCSRHPRRTRAWPRC